MRCDLRWLYLFIVDFQHTESDLQQKKKKKKKTLVVKYFISNLEHKITKEQINQDLWEIFCFLKQIKVHMCRKLLRTLYAERVHISSFVY